MSEANPSQQRLHLLVDRFEQIMTAALEPRAEPGAQPHCFFEGYRLLGVDGTFWSPGHTPTIIAQLPKPATRRLQSALARLHLASVVELGTHSPVAAVVAPPRDSEQVLAGKLWTRLRPDSLIIGDELFGKPRTLLHAIQAVGDRNIRFLAGVRERAKSQVLERYADGSAWIEVTVRDTPHGVDCLRVREIRAIGRMVKTRVRLNLRLWTTLADPQRFPAETLAREYAERWQPELGSRELKLDARAIPTRATVTLEAALQELATVLLASAVLAQLRIEAFERHQLPPDRMSFLELLRATKELWDTLEAMGATLTGAQWQHLLERYVDTVRQAVGRPDRRARYPISALNRQVSREHGSVDDLTTRHIEIEVIRI